jgi:hypothetical protein
MHTISAEIASAQRKWLKTFCKAAADLGERRHDGRIRCWVVLSPQDDVMELCSRVDSDTLNCMDHWLSLGGRDEFFYADWDLGWARTRLTVAETGERWLGLAFPKKDYSRGFICVPDGTPIRKIHRLLEQRGAEVTRGRLEFYVRSATELLVTDVPVHTAKRRSQAG